MPRVLFSGCFLFPVSFFIFSCSNPSPDSTEQEKNDSLFSDLTALNEQIGKNRNNAELYVKRAKFYFSQKDYANAIIDMKIAVRIDSLNPDYHIFLSDLYFTQNQTRFTRDHLRKALSANPKNADALLKYSQLFYLLRQYDTATFYVNCCLNEDESRAVAHYQKGMILKEWGDTAKAIASFQEAVKRDNSYYDAYLQLGLLHAVKKNPLALEYYESALNLNPRSTEALYGKGKFLQDVGELDAAIAVYGNLLSLSPEDQEATFNTGAILFEQKKYDEAFRNFDLTLKRDANFYRGYYGRGMCYEEKGEKPKAIADYKTCLALKNDFEPAAIRLKMAQGRKK